MSFFGEPFERYRTRGGCASNKIHPLSCTGRLDVIAFYSMRKKCDSPEAPMLDLTRDIHPLTDFKRNTAEFLAQLKQTGQPLVLTINGKAELVVQDAASYQKLLALAERLETMQAVKEGLASASRGEGRPMDDVFDGMEKELRADAAR